MEATSTPLPIAPPDRQRIASPETSDWKQVDRQLRRLARIRAAQDFEEGRWLLAARRTETYAHLGYASLAEYAERLFGYEPHTTLERLRVADALEHLPLSAAALREGRVAWSALREITRIATPKTEGAWLETARCHTVRQVEQLVNGRRPGDRPTDPADPHLRRETLRLEVGAEAYAIWREVVGYLRKEIDAQLSDEEALVEMARRALGRVDAGRSNYQTMLIRCVGCGRTWQEARGETIEVPTHVGEGALCDTQFVRVPSSVRPAASDATDVALSHVGPGSNDASAASSHVGLETDAAPAASSHVGLETDAAPAASSLVGLETNAAAPASSHAGPETNAGSLVLSHVGPQTSAAPAASSHVGPVPYGGDADFIALFIELPEHSRSIPSAIRTFVRHRDHGRCRVSGCRNSVHVDVHHIHPFSEGGPHDPDLLIVLCGAHHARLHRGQLWISGTVSTGLRFERADGTVYEEEPSAEVLELFTDAFSALRNMKVPETQVKRALGDVRDRLRREGRLASRPTMPAATDTPWKDNTDAGAASVGANGDGSTSHFRLPTLGEIVAEALRALKRPAVSTRRQSAVWSTRPTPRGAPRAARTTAPQVSASIGHGGDRPAFQGTGLTAQIASGSIARPTEADMDDNASVYADALSALCNLEFKRADAQDAITRAAAQLARQTATDPRSARANAAVGSEPLTPEEGDRNADALQRDGLSRSPTFSNLVTAALRILKPPPSRPETRSYGPPPRQPPLVARERSLSVYGAYGEHERCG